MEAIELLTSSIRASERALAEQMLPALKAGMLLLADRGYPSYRLSCAAQATGAELLWWAAADRHLLVQRVLPDGAYLSRLTDPADSHRQANKRARSRKAGRVPPAPLQPRGPVVRVVEASSPCAPVTAPYGPATTGSSPHCSTRRRHPRGSWPPPTPGAGR